VTFERGAVTGAAKYKLLVGRSTNILDTTKYKCNIDIDSGDITTYTDTGYSTAGCAYYWWVWAYATDGAYSAWTQVLADRSSFTRP
jgi:hypothetical protein